MSCRPARPGLLLRLSLLILPVSLLFSGGETEAFGGRAGEPGAVDPDNLRRHLQFLASDDLRGRQVGTDGIASAEEYIIEAFREAGLKNLPGVTGYAQPFELTRYGYSREGSSLEVRELSKEVPPKGAAGGEDPVERDRHWFRGGVEMSHWFRGGLEMSHWFRGGLEMSHWFRGGVEMSHWFRGGVEVRPLPFSGVGEVSGRMVFAGYGIVAPETERNDYASLQLTGAVAVVLRGEPVTEQESSPFHGEDFTRYAYFSTKAEEAYAAGASALLVVDVPGRRDEGRAFATVPSLTLEESPPPLPPELSADVPADFVSLHVGSRLLELIAEKLGIGVEELVNAADRGESLPGGLPLEAVLRSQKLPVASRLTARNILGRLPASRSGVEGGGRREAADGKSGVVVIGAHHDHLGSVPGPGDSVYNGADDNASGVAALLEIARLLSAVERETEVIFVTFSAEEQGLLGARAFIESGLLDPRRVRVMVNFDMVGRNPGEPVRLYHNRRGPLSDFPFESILQSIGVEAEVITEDRAPSDQVVFHQAGTPTLLFFTGLHEDYHRLDDETQRIDFPRHREATELAFAVIRELVNPGAR